MAHATAIRVAPEQPTQAVCVLGTATQLDVCSSAPKDCTSFSITAPPGVAVDITHSSPAKKTPTGSSKWPLDPMLEVTLRMKAASSSMDDQKVQISYYGPKTPTVQALLYLTGVEISLLADVTRSGKAKPTRSMKDQSTWTWGPSGQGAILLVNCDRNNPQSSGTDCEDEEVFDSKDAQDMSLVTLSTKTPKDFFTRHRLLLHVAKSEMGRVRVFQATRAPRHPGFPGHCGLPCGPLDHDPQYPASPGGVRVQDEMEIGYIQAPHKTMPVVFDSPRDRGLKDFPIRCVLGPNFGYMTRGPLTGEVTGLDAFGNLEVSPPVTVGEKEYPLGRILIGSSCYPSKGSREMHRALWDFLAAQGVQAPVQLYSDWLFVGHVDEFLSFVPAPNRKGFRLLLASPRACYHLLEEQQRQGHGEVLLLEGVKKQKQQRIKDILSNKKLREQNSYAESCIDWNREVLKRELGLAEGDIIDIPQLFKLIGNSRGALKAEAFFPNMVNMLVLGKHVGIPKPFGPIISGRCCLEEKVRSLLQPLGLHCTFIDDYYSYHMRHGEVHCGTNVRRKPFTFKWWHMVP
ncbi:protein-arginine deiminase type-4 isoform X2 [Heterocephalus glaber]|uniref:Protein-arginine deiminase type-4 n=1 Tax=Heterocephalus glaber TaxID=10181 RepID=A0AAX6TDL2_HETGA|nr:protein-arginine deiminase type-4 isoform X2 [Heterocephalus glaber]